MNDQPSPSPKPVPAGRESRDLNARAVACFGAGLLVALAVIFISLYWLMAVFGGPHSLSSAAQRANPAPNLPPEPRLQTNPSVDLQRLRDHENTILNSYGWVDRRAGVVRIPIERAMDLVVQQGLPPAPSSFGKTPLQMRQERTNAVTNLP